MEAYWASFQRPPLPPPPALGCYERLKPTHRAEQSLFTARFMSGLERYFPPCPTTADEKEDGCCTEGVGDACKLGSAWAGWVGEGFFLTRVHTWIPVPRWQPGKLFPCPQRPAPLLWRLLRSRDLLGVLYASERISVNRGLSQGHLRFRMQSSQRDAGAVSVKGFINHSGSSGFFPTLPSNSYFWACDRLGCVTHWTTMSKTNKLSALLELMFWFKKTERNPSTQMHAQFWGHQEHLQWMGWSGKTPPPQGQWYLNPVLFVKFLFLSRNEHVSH